MRLESVSMARALEETAVLVGLVRHLWLNVELRSIAMTVSVIEHIILCVLISDSGCGPLADECESRHWSSGTPLALFPALARRYASQFFLNFSSCFVCLVQHVYFKPSLYHPLPVSCLYLLALASLRYYV